MNSFVAKGLYCALFVGGLSLLGIGAANAAETSGDDGLASGTQLAAVLDAPITLSGNTVSVIDDSSSDSAPTRSGSAPTPDAAEASATTSGAGAIASGTQVPVDAIIPVTVGDNAISVVGDSNTSGASSDAPAESPASVGTRNPSTTAGSSGSGTPSLITDSLLSDSLLGDSLLGESLLGDSLLGDSLLGDSLLGDSQLSGTQVPVQTTTPVTVTGNAVSVFGDSSSGDTSSAAPASGGSSEAATDGGDSVLGGTQVVISGTAPVQVTGNTLSLMSASRSVDGSASPGESVYSGTGTSGGDSSVSIAPVVGLLAPRALITFATADAGAADANTTDANTTGDAIIGAASGAGASTPVGAASPGVSAPRSTLAATSVMSAGARAVVSDGAPMVAAARLTALATAGLEAAPFLALIALFPLVGFGLLLVARRQLERPTRH